MIFEVINATNEENWLVERGKGIGGSDASACLDANPYKTKRELYLEKKNLKPKQEVANPTLVEYGKNAEEYIRELFKLDYPQFKVSHMDNTILVRKDKPYFRGSLDGIIVANDEVKITSYYKAYGSNLEFDTSNFKTISKNMIGVLEIKTSEVLSSMHKEKWNNKVPQNYYIQVLHYLNVTGFDFVLLRVKLVFEDKNKVRTHEFRDYVFLRNEVLNDLITEEDAVDDFWNNYFLKDVEPSLKLM